MKLLRLSSTDEKCFFDSVLNEDLIISPNSKIALKNCSIQSNNAEIEINANNEKITYQLNATVYHTAYLEHNTYPNDYNEDLKDDIQNKLNYAIWTGVHGVQIGSQFKTSIDTETTHFVIDYKQASLQDLNVIPYANTYVPENITKTSAGVYSNDTATEDGWIANSISMCKGFGIFRCRIAALPINNEGEIIFGLVDKNPQTSQPANESAFAYYISFDEALSYININGKTTTSVRPAVGDNLSIEFFDNKLYFRHYYGNADPKQNTPYILETKFGELKNRNLYPFVLFTEDNTAKIDLVRYTGDPFIIEPHDVIPVNDLGAGPPLQHKPATNKTMTIHSMDLANFLGFETTNILPTNSTQNFTITSENNYEQYSLVDSFIVEMLNLKLKSYDYQLHKRRNILAIIPNNDVNNKVIYNEFQPTFIELNYKHEINLRNIQLRVVRQDGSALEIEGESNLTLLIQDDS